MAWNPDNESLIARYLLGELTEPEKNQIEENFLADNDYFEQILTVEDDLIDSYVRGQFSPVESKQFEKNFLTTPQRRQRVAFARTLGQVVSQTPDPVVAPIPAIPDGLTRWQAFLSPLGLQNRSLQFGLMAAALVVLIGTTVWLSVRKTGQPAQREEQVAQQTPEVRQTSPAPIDNREQTDKTQQATQGNEQASTQSPPSNQSTNRAPRLVEETTTTRHALAFLILKPTVRGTGETNILNLKPGQERVRIQIPLEDQNNYQSYALELRTAQGTKILSQAGIKARQSSSGRSIIWTLGAGNFTRRDDRDYTLKINGLTASGETETVEDYFFKVDKK